ncbi:DEKNAAC104470 [Brettanomyces naardenensis]|uniref:DEKNAAC104470 n=1 Tax=Brettanomyces naardenensis TaxID=13370 RepID=A0A448YR44_BRENA|nr:DEKNAAC104470 [Brettanomyces naardenensis]
MTTVVQEIPFPLPDFKTCTGIPPSIGDTRATISPDNLMNSSNILYNYVDVLCTLAHNHQPNADSVPKILLSAKQIPLLQVEGHCPWSNYRIAKEHLSKWTVYDEIVMAVISACLTYNQLTIQNLEEYSLQEEQLTDEAWRKANNLLKQSFSLLNAFSPGVDDPSHSVNLNYVFQLNTALIQLMVVMKNLFLTYHEIDAQFGAFDKLPANLGTYRKILIFIYNKFSVLGSLHSGFTHDRSFQNYKHFLQALYCYYSAAEYYKKNEMGLALGLVEYGLQSVIERDPIRSKLGIQRKKKKVKDKKLLEGEIKLAREFHKNDFPVLLQRVLVIVAKLLRILYVKFDKMNSSLNFDRVVEPMEIEQNYLFTSANLPSGLQVPLANVMEYVPNCLEGYARQPTVRRYY